MDKIELSIKMDMNELFEVTIVTFVDGRVSFLANREKTMHIVEMDLIEFVREITNNDTHITNEVDVNKIVNFLAGGKI